MWSIWTEPKLGIGERAILIQTSNGNVLWDLIAYLDKETIDFIHSIGGIKAIVISHPHFYTTHLEWAKAFNCPVYLASDDKEWICRDDEEGVRRFITENNQEILPGVTAIKCGGHFPGSMVLHWKDKLMIADTMMIVPSGLYHENRLEGTTSFSFMWSYPNLIPLPPKDLMGIWKAIKPWNFNSTHGGFKGLDIRSKDVKSRILESMKIQVRIGGWDQAEILNEL